MSWYRTGTVAVTNGSKTVTGVGTLWTTAVNAGDAFALVDANLNPTGAWYEVESVMNNTTLVLKQSYAGSTGSNKQYCVFNLVGNMTTPSFAQRLATFFASFQSFIDKPTATPTALGIPIADENGDIDSGWLKDASTTVKGVVELATSAEVLAGVDTERAVTPDTLTDKILGTVSQVGGVPTGAVIESGSNANGRYIKFADGTMICNKVFTSISVAISTEWGSLYVSGNIGLGNWAAAFIATPVVSYSCNSGTYFLIFPWGAQTATTAGVVNIARPVTDGAVPRSFNVIGIGRWY